MTYITSQSLNQQRFKKYGFATTKNCKIFSHYKKLLPLRLFFSDISIQKQKTEAHPLTRHFIIHQLDGSTMASCDTV